MTTLETLRQTLEDIETLHHLASASLQSRATPETPHKLLSNRPPTSALDAENLAHELITRIGNTSAALLPNLKEHAVKPCDNPSSAFYTALRHVRETHRAGLQTASVDPLADVTYPSFSGEEAGGSCLDLLEFHRSFVNLRGVPRVDYVTYLRGLPNFSELPPGVRSTKQYEHYLEGLLDYLTNFTRRAHPLEAHIVSDVIGESSKALEEKLSGLAGRYASKEALLEDLGMTGVKDHLLEVGLKCGGSGRERAGRLLEAGRKLGYGRRGVLEHAVVRVVDALCEERHATIANVERKLAQSFAEVAADREGAVVSDDEDDEAAIYNPKDIPLGWDGKPMPYWMYKLHGLNHVFKCEICGGASYRGPRAFERHFSEGVHVAGLRRLGIGYSKAFMMITRIVDATRLKEKMDGERMQESVVEYEDAQGNVMNERTYRDLKRQGLI